MNTSIVLRNKQFNKLNEKEKEEIIELVKEAYLINNLKIDELIKKFNSTKSYMYKFLRDNNIKKSQEQLNAERSKICKELYHNKSKEDLEQIKEKRKQTNLKKYGVENPYQSPEIQEKIKQDNLKKYGVEYAVQRQDVKEKINKSTLESQGAKRYIQTKKGKNKFKQTCLEKYGVENPYQSEEKKKKIKQTCLDRYGNEIPAKTNQIKEKIKQSNLEKFGYEYAVQSPEIRKKLSFILKNKSDEEKQLIIQKIKQTKFERYGDKNYVNKDQIRKSLNNRSFEEKEKTSYKIMTNWRNKSDEEKKLILEKRKQTNQFKYKSDWTCNILDRTKNHGSISNINLKFIDILHNNNISCNLEFHLDNKSYDFKIDNTLIEINPTFTHNSTMAAIFSNTQHQINSLPKDYHLNKSLLAKKYNFFCLHIFDWDDKNKIINRFLPKDIIYARNCELKEVNKKECDEFLDLYHLQNACRGQTIRYGLYYDNKLVELMTFGKPRYNKNYEWELLRLCSHKDYKIVGGSEKLFKHFIREINPQSIISYCDYSKFSGEVYERLGMRFIKLTKPNCIWSKHKLKITNNLLNQRGADQLIGTHDGKGTSNRDVMIREGWKEVYDCGQKIFEYIN